jgi:hypothetical protein
VAEGTTRVQASAATPRSAGSPSTASVRPAPPPRAGNRRFWCLSALRAHTKAPYKTDFHRKTLRALNRPWAARTVTRIPGPYNTRGHIPDTQSRSQPTHPSMSGRLTAPLLPGVAPAALPPAAQRAGLAPSRAPRTAAPAVRIAAAVLRLRQGPRPGPNGETQCYGADPRGAAGATGHACLSAAMSACRPSIGTLYMRSTPAARGPPRE